MKVKDTIEVLKKADFPKEYNTVTRDLLLDIFLAEFTIRQKSRFGQRDVSLDAVMALTKEMSDWIKKVMIGYGFNPLDAEGFSRILFDTTKNIATKHVVSN